MLTNRKWGGKRGEDMQQRSTGNGQELVEDCSLHTWVTVTLHVTGPIHNKGHILGVVISEGRNITDVVVTDVDISDLYCVLYKKNIPAFTSRSRAEVVTRCCINANANQLFTNLPSGSVHK
ncbi:hypothetical protein XENOCAPTIV_003827 [Xenoophorus captivus]|uniref:Uncharacterized protein n=1 Tax=Xenoophorus captivus TaxID=1517983 RepID=A0ABV0RP41_9TELE